MKNLLLLFCVLFTISCGKEQLIEETSNSENQTFAFSKSLSLKDNEGNNVELTVYSNTQEALDNHTQDVLHLIVNKRKRSTGAMNSSNLGSEGEQSEDEKQDNFVYIKVTSFKFNDDVTGFKIKSDIEYIGQQSSYRYSDSFYFYAFGADGVDGARVEYTGETQSKEYLSVKFEKKTASSNWFWQSIATGNLYNVGDVWDHCGSTNWAEFKLKVTVNKAKSGVCCYGFDWEFLINC